MLHTNLAKAIFERIETPTVSGIVVNIISAQYNYLKVPAYQVLSDNDNNIVEVLYLPLGE